MYAFFNGKARLTKSGKRFDPERLLSRGASGTYSTFARFNIRVELAKCACCRAGGEAIGLILYFRDNFFNAGRTEILNENRERVGEVDLRSAFGSALDVFGTSGEPLYGGKFRMLSNKWIVRLANGEECGVLRYRLSFFSKRYEYERYGSGTYEITSPAFSREYEIRNELGEVSASFERVNGWFESSAYRLTANSAEVDAYEWVAVVLGMHEIRKRHRQASS